MKKWKIYVAAHKKIFPEMFENDPLFNNDNYCILNVGPNSHLENEEDYCVLDQKKLPDFIKLGPWWAESEGIYNIWKSGIYKEQLVFWWVFCLKNMRQIFIFVLKKDIVNF